MRIYIVRHGESGNNATNKHNSPDTPLTEKGIQQAHAVGKRYEKKPIKAIFSSDYKRAHETAAIINSYLDKDHHVHPGLRERKRPTIVEGKQKDDPEVIRISELIEKNAHDPHWHYSDEENVHDMYARARSVLKELTEYPYNEIMMVSHKHFTRMLIMASLFEEKLARELFMHPQIYFAKRNAGVSILEKDKKGNIILATWNDFSHL